MKRIAATAVATTCLMMSLAPVRADESEAFPARLLTIVNRFLEGSDDRLHEYRAFRRLEARNDKFNKDAWLEAWTELTPSGFRYQIVRSGGSEYVRSKVLEAALKNEQRLVADGDMMRADLTRANYEFAGSEVQGGLIKVLLKPRRAEQMLVNGAMFLSAVSGDLVRVEGALARNPSFWTRRVNIIREYRRVSGIRVPVRLESQAQVKLAGDSRFLMTYEYQRINGRPVGNLRSMVW